MSTPDEPAWMIAPGRTRVQKAYACSESVLVCRKRTRVPKAYENVRELTNTYGNVRDLTEPYQLVRDLTETYKLYLAQVIAMQWLSVFACLSP